MKLLLDTHVLLWWLADDPTLPAHHRAAIADPAAIVYVSAASAWEVAIKKALGKLEAPGDLSAALADSDLEELPVTVRHADALANLPSHHRDPFDRMLVAQATVEELTIVTVDPVFDQYDVERL